MVRRLTALALAAVASLVLPSAHADQHPSSEPQPLTGIHNDGGRFADDLGRTVVLRGTNAVDKSGWHGELAAPILDAPTIEVAAAAGFNHVRLGSTWASLEHDRGSYDDEYITQLISVLDQLHDAGLVAVIDIHQDVWSEGLGYDGAPAWADPQCNETVELALDEAGLPLTEGGWFAKYASPDVNVAWANFWNDGYGDLDPNCTGPIQTDFIAMWRHLASRLQGHPAVAGYDLLNEPWPTGPPGVFEEVYLMPMYRRVTTAIRQVDPDTPIFFGPPLYSAAVPSAALEAPDPNSVFAPHIYTETMFSGGQLTTGATTDEVALRKDIAEARRLGVPVWIGEWGAIRDARYQRQFYDLLDRHGVSSAHWRIAESPGEDWLTGYEAGHVRVYPEAYPGQATWAFDADTGRFEMTVTVADQVPQPVQLVVPASLGVASDRSDVTLHPDAHRAVWTLPGPGTHTLTLSPAG